MDKPGLMIIGIGNTLRRDDGAGVAVAERLRVAIEEIRGVQLVTTHQLLPELAEQIAQVNDVVFVDARADVTAGRVTVEEVSSDVKPQAAGTGHYVTPAQLLAMARLMYGCEHDLRAQVIGIGAADMDHGEQLSPVVHHAVSRVVEMIYRGVLGWTCDGHFALPAMETSERQIEMGAACQLKWASYIQREMHDA